MCKQYTQDEDQLISIVNDGFLKVFKKIGTFEHKGSFEGWVRRLVFTSLSDFFRKENRYLKFLIFEEVESHIEQESIENLYYQDIIEMVKILPKKSRLVFEKYAIEGYSHKEISEQMEMSVGTSKWYIHEARKRLKKLLKERNIYNSNVR